MTAASLGLSIMVVAARPVPAQTLDRARAPSTPVPKPSDDKDAIKTAVSQLVEQLRQHPAQPSKLAERVAGLYMIDIATGEVTLIADQPDANTTFCGSAAWSSDGKRIFFDAMRTEEVAQARMKVIELVEGKLTLTDLGVGNCPTLSPSGDQIAFLLNHGGVPGVQGGIWAMRANGSGRHRLGSWGRPRWSPDGRQFLVADFAIPAHVSLVDVGSEQRRPVQIGSGMKFWSAPQWVSPGMIVAVVGADWGDTIALVDVTDPAHARIKERFWNMDFKGRSIDVNPHSPVYLASTGSGVFVGGATAGMVLYAFQRGQTGQPKRLEPDGYDALLQDLALSPDGRYVLFSSNRTGPRHRGSPPRALAPQFKKAADK